MKSRITRRQAIATAVLVVIVSLAVMAGASASIAGGGHSYRSEHWGVITRNTIGSPVGDLRNGPYGSFGVTGSLARPPYGKGSLGIETNAVPGFVEKVDYGNEVDFFGDNVLDLNKTGFHVFQTGENVDYGGPRNMPNIRFEIDPNLTTNPSNYTTMVWNPAAIGLAVVNRWSGYLDATTTGDWYFTGSAGVTTGCNEVTTCTFTQAKTSLNDGGDEPIFYTAAVGKGRDSIWVGAVDGFRMNRDIFNFELHGVFRVGDDGDDD